MQTVGIAWSARRHADIIDFSSQPEIPHLDAHTRKKECDHFPYDCQGDLMLYAESCFLLYYPGWVPAPDRKYWPVPFEPDLSWGIWSVNYISQYLTPGPYSRAKWIQEFSWDEETCR
ncbi:uncharacterized protein LOC117173881 [Belonocnema kinseyi]|uniref:uncharacterized protein LOC117173881 n=1 Tax=Belonocnema kinseyi TaxID=2817044 RepID=UPI00143D21CB|nr:uncharacterized protein LOC117173881 [Belonocnema kinseyi]